MKPSALSRVLTKTIAGKKTILITGAPGIGKSEIVKQVCVDEGNDMIISHPVVDSPLDYKGLPYMAEGKADFIPFGNLKLIIDADKPTVYFMDDLGQAPPTVQAAAMQLLLERQINGNKVSDHVTFIAATNRKQDKAGVAGLLEPVKSRFSTIVNLEPDLDDWCKWALGAGLPMELVAFIRFRPELLMDFKPTVDLTNSPCPRTIANIAAHMEMQHDPDVEYEVFAGAAGEGLASELLAFLKIFRHMPNPDAVLMNPSTYQYNQEEPAVAYALCGAIARKASPNNMDRILAVTEVLPDEFGVMMMRDALVHDPDVVNTNGFIKWTVENQDVLM